MTNLLEKVGSKEPTNGSPDKAEEPSIRQSKREHNEKDRAKRKQKMDKLRSEPWGIDDENQRDALRIAVLNSLEEELGHAEVHVAGVEPVHIDNENHGFNIGSHAPVCEPPWAVLGGVERC
jgi:hypothetical protein